MKRRKKKTIDIKEIKKKKKIKQINKIIINNNKLFHLLKIKKKRI